MPCHRKYLTLAAILMGKSLLLFRTLRKDITILFFVCIATIICIDFWLKNIPELFNGGAKIGEIVEKLCLSYISAFVFYFLVVHIKAQKDKSNIYNYVTKKVYMVIGCCWGLLNELSKAANITLVDKYPTDEELTTICKSINPNSPAPLLLSATSNTYANWVQYFDYYKQRSNGATEKVFLKMPFLDTKLVNILAKIEDCSHFNFLRAIINTMPIRNTDLTSFQKTFSDYIKLIKELEEYADKKLKDYK